MIRSYFKLHSHTSHASLINMKFLHNLFNDTSEVDSAVNFKRVYSSRRTFERRNLDSIIQSFAFPNYLINAKKKSHIRRGS